MAIFLCFLGHFHLKFDIFFCRTVSIGSKICSNDNESYKCYGIPIVTLMLEFSRRIQFSGIEYSSRDVLFVLIDHVLGGLLMGHSYITCSEVIPWFRRGIGEELQ